MIRPVYAGKRSMYVSKVGSLLFRLPVMEVRRCPSRVVAGLEEWAALVLPWLPPEDLAAAAATCTSLRHAVATVSARRAADAARGLERHLIPFVNPLVDSRPYSYFVYSSFPILESPSSQPWGGADPPATPSSLGAPFPSSPVLGLVTGCGCEKCGEMCPCAAAEAGLLMECGGGCGCGLECGNRTTQGGVGVRLQIVRDPRKGWGLHAAEFVAKGQFVCEYAGEFLTTEEARRRQVNYDKLANSGKLSPALLVVREHLPSGKACLRVNIDATRIGNIARFINHSCDGGNLSAELIRNSGSLLPRLCFFAAADIVEGEELTFSYGSVRVKQKGLPCHCGSTGCFGVLPSEET